MIRIENCDNLELLKAQSNKSIDLIYCDILYGTGRNFGDYQDLKCDRTVVEEHYIPRLKEMHRVLKSTGSIYLQMDTRINHWIRCLMDDVFGYDNFRNEIVWCYKSGGVGTGSFARKHDTIYRYGLTKKPIFNSQKQKSYMAPGSGKNPAQTYYEDEGGSYTIVNVKDWWDDIGMLATSSYERVDYPTQKPKALLERIIKASSNEGDLVADFYMGSGTTAEVCYDLKRNFIGCDINEKAVNIAVKRVQDAGGNIIQQRL